MMTRSRWRLLALAYLSLAAAACGGSSRLSDGGAGGSTTGAGGHATGGTGGGVTTGTGGGVSTGSGGAAAGTGGHLSTGSGGAGGHVSTGSGGAAGAGGHLSTGSGGSGGSVSTGSGGAGGHLSTGSGGSVSTGSGGAVAGAGGHLSTGSGGAGGNVSTGNGGGGGNLSTGAGGAAGGAAGSSVAGSGGATSGAGGTTGAAGSGAAGNGAAGMPATNCGAAQTLVDSADTLIDLFVVDAGVIVIDTSSVSLIGRDAKVIKAVPFSRQITAAAFDGTTLVIADAAELTVMSTALDVGPTAFLTVSCASAVLVGENHFVCGPANDWDRVFYTYDIGMNPPAQIAASGQYTYDGIPMRRVPGADAFVTVTLDLSPPSFYLFQVAADTGVTSILGGSPFDAYDANQVFAFDGTPATHMIQDQGDIVGLTGSGCQSMQSYNSGCFAQTGVLGTLRTGQRYVGLGDNGAGQLVAVVGQSTYTYPYGSACASGCPIQLIDIASRTVLQQQSYTIADLASVVRAAYDPGCGTAVLGYGKVDPSNTINSKGYRVQAFAF